MRTELALIAAPTAIQPGGYVNKAYADRVQPKLATAVLETDFARGRGYKITLGWQCDSAVNDIRQDTNLFPDACALLVPVNENSPWITMGDEHNPVEGVLWRADKSEPYKIEAHGLGSVVRSSAPQGWAISADWKNKSWQVSFTLPQWAALEKWQKLAVAVWLGGEKERAGLKSISQGWVSVA